MSSALLNLNRIAAIALFDEQIDKKARRIDRLRRPPEETNIDGVAAAVLSHLDPELVERARTRIAGAEALAISKQQAQAKPQERPQQRQKKRVKEQDRGMEL